MKKRRVVSQSKRSQVKTLPKAVARAEDAERVDLAVSGRPRAIAPVGGLWDSWFDAPGVAADFMGEREQPADQEPEAP